MTDELLATRSRPHDERLILESLIPTAPDLVGDGPAGYVRQFLVPHAAAAHKLDDDHVSTDFLPWDTSGKVSVLLGFPRPKEARHRRLNAWAALEPYLMNADFTTRRRSLGFAIAASDRHGAAADPSKDAITPQWAHWVLGSNILVHVPEKASIRALTVFTSGYGRQLVAAGCLDSTVRIWDLATGEQAGRALKSSQAEGSIWGVAKLDSHDGDQLLAACGGDGAVRIWNLNDGHETTLLGHTAPVRGLVTFVSSSGRRMLASAGLDHTVRLWDVEAAAPVGPPLTGHTDGVHAIAVFADADGSPLLATGGWDGTLRIWSPADGTETAAPIFVYEGWVRAVLPIKDHLGRQLLATGGGDRRIRFWDPRTGQEAREPLTLPGPGRVTALASIAGGDGGSLLVSGGSDREVRIWSLQTGEQTTRSKIGHGNWISSLGTFTTSDGRNLVVSAAGPDCTLRMWDPTQDESGISGSSLGWLRGVAFSPDRKGVLTAATCSGDAKVRLWDAATGAPTAVMAGHSGWVRSICALRQDDGRSAFVTGGSDKIVRIWDAEASSEAGAFHDGHTATVWAVTAFADGAAGAAIASGDDDNRIIVRRLDGSESPLVLAGHAKGVRGLTTFRAPGGDIVLASVAADYTLRLWNPSTGTAIGEPIQAHTAAVRAVAAYTVDGKPRLVTGGCDNMARTWDPATGARLAEFSGHTGWVLAVATVTHTCGRCLLVTGAGDGDQSVRLWDEPTQRQLARLVVGAQVQSVAAWPHDTPAGEATIAFSTVAGVAVICLALDQLCASPGCRATATPQDQHSANLRMRRGPQPDARQQLHAPKMERLRVLILGAAADGGLRVGREQKRIRAAVDSALHRDRIELDIRPAATTSDLLDGITKFRPHIVHFSGHSSHDVLLFEDELNAHHRGMLITAGAFARAVVATDDPPLLVLLNSCNSASQVRELVERVIPFAIGMAEQIEDNDAITYAAQFYAAIANGQSILSAHLSARAALELAGFSGHELPTLVHAEGFNPAATVLVKIG